MTFSFSTVSAKREFQATDLNSVEEQWTLHLGLCHRLRCILLVHSIFSSPTVWEGINSNETTTVATALISLLRSQSLPRSAPIRDYYLLSWYNYSHLLLGGIALSNGGCPQRNDMVYQNLNVVCLWVVNELEFIGKADSAEKLKGYWETKDFGTLLRFSRMLVIRQD